MVFKGFIAAAASVALMATPAVASAAESAATTQAATAVAPADENAQGNELRGGFIIPLIAIVAIILGILAATSNGKKTPNSP